MVRSRANGETTLARGDSKLVPRAPNRLPTDLELGHLPVLDVGHLRHARESARFRAGDAESEEEGQATEDH